MQEREKKILNELQTLPIIPDGKEIEEAAKAISLLCQSEILKARIDVCRKIDAVRWAQGTNAADFGKDYARLIRNEINQSELQLTQLKTK